MFNIQENDNETTNNYIDVPLRMKNPKKDENERGRNKLSRKTSIRNDGQPG